MSAIHNDSQMGAGSDACCQVYALENSLCPHFGHLKKGDKIESFKVAVLFKVFFTGIGIWYFFKVIINIFAYTRISVVIVFIHTEVFESTSW